MFDPFGPPGPRISHLVAFFSFYHQPFENIEVQGSGLFILGSHDRKKKNERGSGGAGRFGHSEESDRAATSLPVRLFELHNFEQMPFFPLRV